MAVCENKSYFWLWAVTIVLKSGPLAATMVTYDN